MADLEALQLGETYPQHDILPPGDSGAIHLAADGLFYLAAYHNLTTTELDGFRDGTFRIAIGRGMNSFVAVALKHPGGGWSDSYLTRLTTSEPDDDRDQANVIHSWTQGNHGVVRACLVDRDANDAVAALRLFTLSTHATATIAKLLTEMWSRPPVTPERYQRDAAIWKREHPDVNRWVRDYALATCKGGD